MLVKTDTKEKFHVITLPGPSLSATMTEELKNCLLTYLQNDVKNVVVTLKDIKIIDNAAAETIIGIQQQFYAKKASFVVCELQKSVEDFFDANDLLDSLNMAPTESEAADIVQMEEMEREMFDEESQN